LNFCFNIFRRYNQLGLPLSLVLGLRDEIVYPS
jgi:hypothetical protein